MKRYIVYGLIACLAALLVLPLAGCKFGSSDSTPAPTPGHPVTGAAAGSNGSGGGIGSHNKDTDDLTK